MRPVLHSPGSNPFTEQAHPNKAQWIGAFDPVSKDLKALGVTVTDSDRSTGRIRPPRTWFDALVVNGVGGVAAAPRPQGPEFPNLEVKPLAGEGLEERVTPPGASPSYLLTVRHYEKYPGEYYVQGGGTKQLYQDLKIEPGDLLIIKYLEMHTIRKYPVLAVTVLRRHSNPYAAGVLGRPPGRARRPGDSTGTGGGTKKEYVVCCLH